MDEPDATEDSHLVERRVSGQQVYAGRLLDVRRDVIALPDGSTATREYVVHPGAVMVVPLLDDGLLLMERQFRYPVARVMLEFPAGKLDAGEPPFECAVRELAEETGYQAREWAHAGVLHNAIAYSDEGIEIYFARGLTSGPQQLDDGEFLELVQVSVPELEAMCADGRVTDAKTLIGLLWLTRWQRGDWPLNWFKP